MMPSSGGELDETVPGIHPHGQVTKIVLQTTIAEARRLPHGP